MLFAGLDGGIVLPFRRTWQGIAAPRCNASHRKGDSPIVLSQWIPLLTTTGLRSNSSVYIWQRMLLIMAFYSLDETGAPDPALNQATLHGACAPAPGRVSSCGEHEITHKFSKEIWKEHIEHQRNKNTHLWLLHLWRQMSIYSVQE